jgi:hypothetical protein
MPAIIYALVFGVLLGFLSADATTLWLKVIGYGMAAWMFIAAIISAFRMTRDSD